MEFPLENRSGYPQEASSGPFQSSKKIGNGCTSLEPQKRPSITSVLNLSQTISAVPKLFMAMKSILFLSHELKRMERGRQRGYPPDATKIKTIPQQSPIAFPALALTIVAWQLSLSHTYDKSINLHQYLPRILRHLSLGRPYGQCRRERGRLARLPCRRDPHLQQEGQGI